MLRKRTWLFVRAALAVLCALSLLAPVGLSFPHLTAQASAAVSVQFTNPITTSGGITMTASGKGDSEFSFTTVQGQSALQVDKYAYFQVTDPTLCAADEVTLTVTFLDGDSHVVMQYCGTGDAYTYAHIYTTKSGQLRTVSVPLRDAALGDAAQNFRSAFRLCGGTVLSIAIQEGISDNATVTFTDPVSTTAAIDVIPSSPQSSDSAYTLTTVQGKPVAKLDKYAYFRVNDTTLKYSKEVTITLTYLDEGNSPILLQYCSTNADYELLHVQRFNTGEFVTVDIPLHNASLGKAGQNFGAAFRFYGGTIHSLSLSVGCSDDTEQAPPTFAPQTEQNNIIGKGIAGYQVWFRANDTTDDWHHWAQDGTYPTAGNVHPEIYPYTDDYVANGATLYQTGLADLGNGNPALLFNSADTEVIQTHMQWAQEYNIDGLAVQRFYSATFPMRSTGSNTLNVIQEQAEAHGRIFYVMYDFSFASRTNPETFIRNVKLDFIYSVEEKGVASSPNYGHADGKPVVCLWGLHGDPASEYFCGETATTLIEWFRSRGYYVIGGSPDNNYDEAEEEYLEPFTKLDMLSLWTVGRYNMNNVERWMAEDVTRDLAFCAQYDIDYQPVIWSGFGWTNMGNNGYVNHYPRYAGDYLWKQAYILKRDYNIESVYFAMWDEYDEGTAIMKGAADYFEIPTDQYFLTWAADGWWLSNDYYLRAAEAALDMIQGEAPLQDTLDIPHSLGPVYWRNSFESRKTTYTDDHGETIKTTLGQLDVCLNNPTWLVANNFTIHAVDIRTDMAKSGDYAFRFSGTASNRCEAIYKIADTQITASAPLELSYSLLATNENGQDVFVDLIFSDGTRLSDINADTVTTRQSTREWVDVTVTLGPTADAKTVVGIAVGYRGAAGDVIAYIDDIVLQHSADAHVWDDGHTNADQSITFTCQNKSCGITVREHSALTWGDVNDNGTVNSTDARLTLQYAVGKVTPTSLNLSAADVDGNGKVDSTDARLILQYTVQKIDAFPVEDNT